MRKVGPVVALLAAGLVPLLSPGPASAGGGSTIIVTTTVDELNGTGDNVISLREAVSLAEDDPGNTQIRLPDGVYNLTRCGDPDEDLNATGDLDQVVSDSLQVARDEGTDVVTIRQTCGGERVLEGPGNLAFFSVGITGGSSPSPGGGVLSTAGSITVSGDAAEVYGNTSEASGGGLDAALSIILSAGAVVRDNEAAFDGGGIRAGAGVLMTDAQVSDNEAGGNGGGVRGLGAGFVSVVRSTVGRNLAGSGGGIYLEADSVEMEDSTVAQNRVTGVNGVGGIFAADEVDALQSTIAGNETANGGTANISTPTFSPTETVVADPVGGPNCTVSGGLSGGYNVEEGSDTCDLDQTTDLPNTGDPGLQALFPNGGATETLYLAKTSFLRDLVALTSGPCSNADDFDQRFVERPQGPLCDTGAVEIQPCGQFFGDVGASHPFCWEIGWMSEAGITTGFPGGLYKPNDAVKRQSMSAFLYRLAGSPEFADPPTATFSDVPTSSQFFTEIEWMNAAGITTGFPGGLFKPNDTVKRQSMSAFMFRMVDPSFTDPPSATFSDVPTSSQFFTEIEWMAEENITTGFPGGLFKPNQNVTRQSMSAFMFRLAPFVSGGVQF